MNSKRTTTGNSIDLPALEIVLGSLIAAGKSETTREKLYEDFLPRLVASTQSLAAAVLFKRPEAPIATVSQYGWQQIPPPAQDLVKEQVQLACRAKSDQRAHPIASNQDLTVSTFVGKTGLVDGGEFLCVVVRKRDADSLVERLLSDLVQEIAAEIENIEYRRTAGNQPLVVRELTRLVQLTQNVAKTQNLNQLALHLVNDLSRITGADRVSFFKANGKLLAISGVSSIAKSKLTKTLSRLARSCGKDRQSIEATSGETSFTGNTSGRKLKSLLNELDAPHFMFLPILNGKRCSGVIAFEYFESNPHHRDWIDQQKLVSRSIEFIAPVVNRAVAVHSIPGFRGLDWLFNRALTNPIRILISLALLVGLLLAAYYGLFLVERPFEIQAEGRLRPKVMQHLFAPDDGEVRDLKVADAQDVGQGEPLLRLESQVLIDQQIAIEGELAEIDKRLKNLVIADLQSELSSETDAARKNVNQAAQTAAELEQLKLRQITLEKRLMLLTTRQTNLRVESPIAGQITTPDIEQRLRNRPVNRGDWLLSIADLQGEWEIELDVPDNRIVFLQDAGSPRVKFRLVASPDRIFVGQLRGLDFMARPADPTGSRMVTAWVDLDEGELNDQLRYGSRVLAKFNCGNRTNWFLLTYELRQKLSEWWLW